MNSYTIQNVPHKYYPGEDIVHYLYLRDSQTETWLKEPIRFAANEYKISIEDYTLYILEGSSNEDILYIKMKYGINVTFD